MSCPLKECEHHVKCDMIDGCWLLMERRMDDELKEVNAAGVELCHCALSGEAHVIIGGRSCEACRADERLSLTAENVEKFFQGMQALINQRAKQIDLMRLKEVNKRRCEAPDGFNHSMDEWSVAEWTNAITGEVGEALLVMLEISAHAGLAGNIAKKLIRFRAGVRGNSGTQAEYEKDLAKELADIILYCDLTATKMGIDLWSVDGAVVRKFNEVSNKIGSEIKL